MPKTRESGGILKSLQKGLTSVGKTIVSKVGDYVMGRKPYEETFKASINLPHGGCPKTYCRFIRYKPKNFQLSSDLEITLTIKPNTIHCHHEDTHLFMRFIE